MIVQLHQCHQWASTTSGSSQSVPVQYRAQYLLCAQITGVFMPLFSPIFPNGKDWTHANSSFVCLSLSLLSPQFPRSLGPSLIASRVCNGRRPLSKRGHFRVLCPTLPIHLTPFPSLEWTVSPFCKHSQWSER